MSTAFKAKFFLIYFLLLFSLQQCYASSPAAKDFLDSGIVEFGKGNYDKAKTNFVAAIQLAKKSDNLKLLSNAYNNLGNSFANTGNSIEALKNYQLSVSIAERIRDTTRLAKTLKNIGTVYSEQKDFTMALSFYERALVLAQRIKDSSIIADCYNNQGVVYEQQNSYDKAVDIYAKALVIYKAEGNDERISMGLNNLGIVYKYLKNYAASIQNYEEALLLAQKAGDKFMIAATINNLGGVYLLKNEPEKALSLFKQALDTALLINATEIIIENYDGIATAYETLKQYEAAIQYRKLYEKEKNEFINSQRSGQLAEMQTKYETEKKESEIKILKQKERISKLEIQEQKLAIQKRNYYLIGGLLLLLAVASGLYFWIAKQQLKNKLEREIAIKKTEENERLRIAKDIHDDLGSGLSKINFLSELIIKNASQYPEIKGNSESVSETARKMVENMRDLIWALNPENTTLANLIARIREYTSDYLEDFPIELKTSYPEVIPQSPINKESHRGIFMVVKEALNNIVKHAHPTEIEIIAELTNSSLSLQIRDNGIGFSTTDTNLGNGLRNMKNRINAAGGSFQIQSIPRKGTSIQLFLPLSQVLKS